MGWTALPDYQENLEDLCRRRVLLPGTEVAQLYRAGPARFDRVSENLMSRRAGHFVVDFELHIADRLDDRVGNRRGLPRIPGPRSCRERYLEGIAARKRQLAAIVGLGSIRHARERAAVGHERQCGCARDQKREPI